MKGQASQTHLLFPSSCQMSMRAPADSCTRDGDAHCAIRILGLEVRKAAAARAANAVAVVVPPNELSSAARPLLLVRHDDLAGRHLAHLQLTRIICTGEHIVPGQSESLSGTATNLASKIAGSKGTKKEKAN